VATSAGSVGLRWQYHHYLHYHHTCSTHFTTHPSPSLTSTHCSSPVPYLSWSLPLAPPLTFRPDNTATTPLPYHNSSFIRAHCAHCNTATLYLCVNRTRSLLHSVTTGIPPGCLAAWLAANRPGPTFRLRKGERATQLGRPYDEPLLIAYHSPLHTSSTKYTIHKRNRCLRPCCRP
jgi:hypothetical protein